MPKEPQDSDVTVSRRTRKRQAVHEALLLALFELISERGVNAVVVGDITERADVAPNTFYNHFESRDAAIEELVDDMLDAHHAALTELDATAVDSAVIKLSATVDRVLEAARTTPKWTQFMANIFETPFWRRGHFAEQVEAVLKLGQQQGTFTDDGRTSARAALIAAQIRAAIQLIGDGHDLDNDLVLSACLHHAGSHEVTPGSASSN